MTYTKSALHYAEQAAEAIRALNHVTRRPGAYEWPSDADRVIGELHLSVTRLEQALTQTGHWLTTAAAAGQIGHDQGHDPTAAVQAATERLTAIGRRSTHLADDLDAVRQITAHLTGTA